jgi:hypothetical protein
MSKYHLFYSMLYMVLGILLLPLSKNFIDHFWVGMFFVMSFWYFNTANPPPTEE